MTVTDVNITTNNCNGKKIIDAPAVTVITKSNQVKFINQLESTGADPDDGVGIKISFFKATEAGEIPISATLVCKNYTEDDALIIEALQHKNCKMDDATNYKYMVTADTGYDALDPVIIVEPPPIFLFGTIALVGAAVIGLGVAYYVGFRIGSSRDKS